MFHLRVIFIFCSLFLLSNSGFSQKGVEVGAWLGTSVYFGDLNTRFNLTDPGFAGGFLGRYNFDERISVKGSLNYATIHADDSDSSNSFERERNLNFNSMLFDFTAHAEFNFFPYIHGHKELNFTPYLAAGVSLTRFNPRTEFFDVDLQETITVDLQPLGTEGQLPGEEYSRFTPGLSIGGGFKFDLSREWSINIEVATRLVTTDFLDDVSGVFGDPNTIDNSRGIVLGSGLSPSDIADRSFSGIGEEGKQRGNARDNDSYTFVGVSIVRYFGTLQCPKPSTIF